MKHQTSLLFLVCLFATAYAPAATIVMNPNPPVSASSIVDNITGADMGGLLVTATYSTPGSPTVVNLTWAPTGATSGAASSGAVSVSLTGNTSASLAWQYSSIFLSPPLSLEFDGAAAGIYFDRTSPNPGTPRSGPGGDLVFGPLIPNGIDSAFNVTYSSAVSLGGGPAQNDLYARLRLDFFGLLQPQNFAFTQDTDATSSPSPPPPCCFLADSHYSVWLAARIKR